MKCKDIMKTDVECLSPTDSVHSAAECMRSENVGFLPVCSDGRVIGTVTDRDLAIRVLATHRDGLTQLGDVMTREVVKCRPDDNLRTAEELMAQYRVSRIVCVGDDDKLEGIISLSDIAQRERPRRAMKTWQRVTEREARA